jgi:hypothetical protein
LRSNGILLSLLLVGVQACRCGASPPGEEGREARALETASRTEEADPPSELLGVSTDVGERIVGDASTRFRDAAPSIDVDIEGPPDPACTGGDVALASAIVDVRCATDAARAKKLRALLERDGGAAGLRQEARVVEGGRLALRLVNGSGSTLVLPLSFHGKLPAFSVLAEDERHTLYELAPPALELRDPGEGARTHFARIALTPGGSASAILAIAPAIVRVLGRGAGDPCRGVDAAPQDGGPCNLASLPKGTYVLHVGELLTDVAIDAQARVIWTLP